MRSSLNLPAKFPVIAGLKAYNLSTRASADGILFRDVFFLFSDSCSPVEVRKLLEPLCYVLDSRTRLADKINLSWWFSASRCAGIILWKYEPYAPVRKQLL